MKISLHPGKVNKVVKPEINYMFVATLTPKDTIKIVILDTKGKFVVEKQLTATEARILRLRHKNVS